MESVVSESSWLLIPQTLVAYNTHTKHFRDYVPFVMELFVNKKPPAKSSEHFQNLIRALDGDLSMLCVLCL